MDTKQEEETVQEEVVPEVEQPTAAPEATPAEDAVVTPENTPDPVVTEV